MATAPGRARRTVGSGEVRVAGRAGHLIHHDRPDLVVAAIRDLIS